MKKIILIVSIIALGALSFSAAGQARITTKKMKLSDFPTKTTRVVLAGSDMFNNALKDEITRRWMATPYEFCTLEEYEAGKNSPDYYYLIPVSSRMKKEAEPGIIVLSLVKGGPKDTKDAEKQGFEVMSIPCAALESPSGREYLFLPAFIDIIQQYMADAMISDRVSYGGLGSYTSKLIKEREKKIVFSSGDLATTVIPDDEWLDKNMEVMDEEDADALFAEGASGILVSYVVTPTEPVKGSVCYKMILSADTHELCFFEKHQIKGENVAGFLPVDIKLIALPRKK